MAMSESYKNRILLLLAQNLNGMTLKAVKASFPHANLRVLEKEGLTVYKDEKWFATKEAVAQVLGEGPKVMTGHDLLARLLLAEKENPSLLDKPLVATFGNDSNGNAQPITVDSIKPAESLDINGVVEHDVHPNSMVVVLAHETNPEDEQFVEYLTQRLIPDLKESRMEATAEDFEKAVSIICRLGGIEG